MARGLVAWRLEEVQWGQVAGQKGLVVQGPVASQKEPCGSGASGCPEVC